MITSISCSWCHTMNTLVEGVKNLCRHCGHRADKCRLECDCPQCFGRRSVGHAPIGQADFLEALRRFFPQSPLLAEHVAGDGHTDTTTPKKEG